MSTVNTAGDVVEQSIESKIIALSRKAVSQAFWRKEVEEELKEMGWNDRTINTSSPSWEKALEKIGLIILINTDIAVRSAKLEVE